MKFLLPSLIVVVTSACPLSSYANCVQDESVIRENKEQSLKLAKTAKYEHLLTQYAKSGGAPDLKLLMPWILTEINNGSVMRDQIGDAIYKLQENGRNSDRRLEFFTRDNVLCSRIEFKAEDIKLKLIAPASNGIYKFLAVISIKDAYHGGHTIYKHKFGFQVKVEYFKYTKSYSVTIIKYPAYESTEDVDCEYKNSSKPAECG